MFKKRNSARQKALTGTIIRRVVIPRTLNSVCKPLRRRTFCLEVESRGQSKKKKKIENLCLIQSLYCRVGRDFKC